MGDLKGVHSFTGQNFRTSKETQNLNMVINTLFSTKISPIVGASLFWLSTGYIAQSIRSLNMVNRSNQHEAFVCFSNEADRLASLSTICDVDVTSTVHAPFAKMRMCFPY